ncbi:MAG: hypothetical protein V4813_13250 [Gemmatimonadota bacterium]
MTRFQHVPLPALLKPSGRTHAILNETVAHMQSEEPSLMYWSGMPGMGKTCASRQLAAYLRKERNGLESSVLTMDWGGALSGKSTRGMHRGLSAVYKTFVADETDRFLKNMIEQTLAADIVEACRRQETVLLRIDEAGLMSADEMRGIGKITDRAIEVGYRMHILLIAMDDITPKLERYPVLESRGTLDCDFPPWTPAQVVALLPGCGAPLAAVLAQDASLGLPLATQLLDATGGDLRTIKTLARRVSDGLAAPRAARLAFNITTLTDACIAHHREARDRRAARAEIGVLRRRTQRRGKAA